MTTPSKDLVSLEELRAVLRSNAGPDSPRARTPRLRAHRLRLLLLAAVAVAASAGASIAIAASLGAFNGISAAQHPQTGADVLDASTLAQLRQACPPGGDHGRFYMPFCHLVLDSTRLVAQLPSSGNVYVVTDTRGDLCTVWEAGGTAACGPPLSTAQPISFGTLNASPTTGGTFVAAGLAMDGVSSVSFTVAGQAVEVPVKNNVWIYEQPNSHATQGRCVAAHLENGSTVNPFPEAPCP